MRTKLRVIKQDEKYPVYGVSIPREIAIFFQSVEFTVVKSGASIILTSGCSIAPTQEQVNKYKFEDVRI